MYRLSSTLSFVDKDKLDTCQQGICRWKYKESFQKCNILDIVIDLWPVAFSEQKRDTYFNSEDQQRLPGGDTCSGFLRHKESFPGVVGCSLSHKICSLLCSTGDVALHVVPNLRKHYPATFAARCDFSTSLSSMFNVCTACIYCLKEMAY